MNKVVVKRFENPDETRTLDKWKLDVIRVGNATIGRVTCEPGWKWSKHMAPGAGTKSCQVHHVGLVISGRHSVVMDDGRKIDLAPGDVYDIPPGHDAWVVGEEVYVSMQFQGADSFGK